MKLIRDLSESRMFPSTHAYTNMSARQVADMAYLVIITLRILLAERHSEKEAKSYAAKTARHGDFLRWYGDATDLHFLLHALLDEDVVLKLPERSTELKELLSFDPTAIRNWLRDGAHGTGSESRTRRLFTKLDGWFRINDTSMRSIRRLVQEWPDLSPHEQQTSMTRLLQFMRSRGPRCDIRPLLENLAHTRQLEIKDACDQETGNGCEVKKPSFMSRVAGGVAAAGLGYAADRYLRKPRHMEEDASAGATASGAIASVAQPLGGIMRRPQAK
jgi:hypothetical protein